MLGDANMDHSLGRIELGAGLEQIKGRSDRRRAQSLAGGRVMAAPQPGPEAFAADRPGFPVTVDAQICESDTRGGVEERELRFHPGEHVSDQCSAASWRCSTRLVRGLIRSNPRVLRTSGLPGFMRRQTAFVHARLSPQLAGDLDRIDAGVLPPGCFVADAMDQPMVDTAERHRELVARLAAKRPRLQMAQVMRI